MYRRCMKEPWRINFKMDSYPRVASPTQRILFSIVLSYMCYTLTEREMPTHPILSTVEYRNSCNNPELYDFQGILQRCVTIYIDFISLS